MAWRQRGIKPAHRPYLYVTLLRRQPRLHLLLQAIGAIRPSHCDTTQHDSNGVALLAAPSQAGCQRRVRVHLPGLLEDAWTG